MVGDGNPKFFQALTSIRKRKNCISSIMVNGKLVEDLVQKKKKKKKLHLSLETFSKKNSTIDPYWKAWISSDLMVGDGNPKFFLLDWAFLTWWNCWGCASCSPDKASRPDDFNFKFIKSVWNVIKQDIYDVIKKLWSTCHLPHGCNTAFITLIPIIDHPSSFKEFRPISMVGCLYKIVAKLLTNRLKQVINSLVGPLQSSFIKDRPIMDGALITGEIIDSYKRKKKSSSLLKILTSIRHLIACLGIFLSGH